MTQVLLHWKIFQFKLIRYQAEKITSLSQNSTNLKYMCKYNFCCDLSVERYYANALIILIFFLDSL